MLFGPSTSLFSDNKNNKVPKTNKSFFSNKFFPNNESSAKCNHSDKYCAFHINGDNNLFCYNCIYKYNFNKEECIPLEKDLDYYLDVYRNYYKEVKDKVNNIVDEILEELKDLELNENDDINSVLEKINLKFKLPIEVSFEERLKIGINRALSSKISNLKFLNNYNKTHPSHIVIHQP